MTEPVVFLDGEDCTLHATSSEHLVTYCGIPLEVATVGPLSALLRRSARYCTGCFVYEGGEFHFDQGGAVADDPPF